MGLRSLVDTIPAAFIGSVEMSLPFFGGEEGVCSVLEPITGDIQGESSDRRWHTLLSSGCRTGREFTASWDMLQGEATDCCIYLGEELEGELASPVVGMGDGRVDQGTSHSAEGEIESQSAQESPCTACRPDSPPCVGLSTV